MNYISEDILKVSRKLGIQASLLSPEESDAIRDKVARRFGLDKADLQTCTSSMTEYKVICNDDAWRWIGDFLRGWTAFLLVGEGALTETWRVAPGERVVELLGETFGFVFFVTNDNADYLLCYDDHNCLIGFGSAASWIGEMKSHP